MQLENSRFVPVGGHTLSRERLYVNPRRLVAASPRSQLSGTRMAVQNGTEWRLGDDLLQIETDFNELPIQGFEYPQPDRRT